MNKSLRKLGLGFGLGFGIYYIIKKFFLKKNEFNIGSDINGITSGLTNLKKTYQSISDYVSKSDDDQGNNENVPINLENTSFMPQNTDVDDQIVSSEKESKEILPTESDSISIDWDLMKDFNSAPFHKFTIRFEDRNLNNVMDWPNIGISINWQSIGNLFNFFCFITNKQFTLDRTAVFNINVHYELDSLNTKTFMVLVANILLSAGFVNIRFYDIYESEYITMDYSNSYVKLNTNAYEKLNKIIPDVLNYLGFSIPHELLKYNDSGVFLFDPLTIINVNQTTQES